MPMTRQEFVFWIREEDREERKKEKWTAKWNAKLTKSHSTKFKKYAGIPLSVKDCEHSLLQQILQV